MGNVIRVRPDHSVQWMTLIIYLLMLESVMISLKAFHQFQGGSQNQKFWPDLCCACRLSLYTWQSTNREWAWPSPTSIISFYFTLDSWLGLRLGTARESNIRPHSLVSSNLPHCLMANLWRAHLRVEIYTLKSWHIIENSNKMMKVKTKQVIFWRLWRKRFLSVQLTFPFSCSP